MLPDRSLTSREDSDNDPFVDEEGQLDFSEATVDDTGRYRCTAVDELGSREGHVFYVDVSHVGNSLKFLCDTNL